MEIKFSKTERKYLRLALLYAIDWEDSSIDAYTTELYRSKGRIERRVPKSERKTVAVFKRNMNHFHKLYEKLKDIEGQRR